MDGSQEWSVSRNRRIDGMQTNVKEVKLRNFGPGTVGVRLDGRPFPDQRPGQEIYSLPGSTVLLEVLFKDTGANGVFEFQIFS